MHPQSARESEQLRALVDASFAADGAQHDFGGREAALEAWRASARDDVELYPVAQEALERESFRTIPLVHRGAERTYHTHLHLSSAWDEGDLAGRVQQIIQTAFDRIAQGRSEAFVRRAMNNKGLTGRRERSRPFPHPLPYSSTSPSSADAVYAEEAAVLAAALHFPLSRTPPGIEFYVRRFDKRRGLGGGWTRGRAPLDQYNYEQNLLIRLNARALVKGGFDDDEWAGVVAHEVLHNLGWGHGRGDYDEKLAIETYEWCVATPNPA
jgi:hypothetical protein